MVKITITGASGRMGSALIRLVQENPRTTLVGATVRSESSALGIDAGINAGIEPVGIILSDDLDTAFADANVVIDFCPAESTIAHLELCKKHNLKLVLGSTGLDSNTDRLIKSTANDTAIVYASNFSIGVNLLFSISQKAGAILSANDFEVHIDETHHIHKLDAPSGTALSLGKAVALGRKDKFDSVYKYKQNRQNKNDIIFADHREGDVIGDHTVSFHNNLETVSLTHNAHNRDVFAYGAIVAGIWINNKSNGLYSMIDVLDI